MHHKSCEAMRTIVVSWLKAPKPSMKPPNRVEPRWCFKPGFDNKSRLCSTLLFLLPCFQSRRYTEAAPAPPTPAPAGDTPPAAAADAPAADAPAADAPAAPTASK
jgi:hypothetical protein